MKKKLESDLMRIAQRILKLEGREDINKLFTEVSELYEKLSVLKFAQEYFEDDMPAIGSGTSFFNTIEKAFNNKISDTIEIEDQVYVNLDESEDDEIFEPVMEKIKDMVAQMPEETQAMDALVESVIPKNETQQNELEKLVADYQEIPVFEPKTEPSTTKLEETKKSLNDSLKKKEIVIGLNDKIAFIKYLFDGQTEQYEHALAHLNTLNSCKQAVAFIQNNIKPDYNNWHDKEEFENRFMHIIETKFD